MSIFDVLKKIASPLNPSPKTTPPFVGEWNQQPKSRLPEILPITTSQPKPNIFAKLPPIGEVTANNAPIQTEIAANPLLPEISAQPVKPNPFAKLGEIINQPIQTVDAQATRPRVLPEIPVNTIAESFDRPRIAPGQPINDVTSTVVNNPRESQQTLDKIAAIQNKNYGFERDPQTGEILRDENGKKIYGKDRDKTHNWKDILRSVGIGALQGAGSGNGLGGILGGAISGGVAGTLDRNFDNKWNDQRKLGQLQNQYGQQVQAETDDQAYKMREMQRQTIKNDDDRQADVAATNKAIREGELNRKIEKDKNDAESDRLDRIDQQAKRIADVVNRSTVFDPKDPANAETVKMMREYGIPVIAKTGNQDVKYTQDERTGAWWVTTTGKQAGSVPQTRPLTTKDGKQLVTTSKSVVSGEYANQRNSANIQSREGIAAANNQQKSDAVREKINASKNGAMKPGELMRAITNRANRLMISIDEAKKQYKDAGFNVDILN